MRLVPLFAPGGPVLDLNFLTGTLPSVVTFTRSSGATSALYTDAAGAAFTTYTSNQARLSSSGLLIEEARTNSLLNSGSPATQTTGSLGTGTYVLFGNGSGTLTSAAGTATGSGFGTISTLSGNFQTITITVAGTVTITVSGTVDWFDLQAGTFPTSHIVTTGAAATRSVDVASVSTGAFAWSRSAATIYAEAIAPPIPASGTSLLWEVNGGGGNRYGMDFTTSPLHIENFFRTNVSLNTSGGNVTGGAVVKSILAVNGSSAVMSVNGGAPITTTGATFNGTFSTIGIGASVSFPTASELNNCMRRLKIWNRALSAAQVQGLTQ
jgi:hypothetical protein